MELLVIILDVFFLTFILFYSLWQFNLAIIYLKNRKNRDLPELSSFPTVTVQLPVFNEKYVVERLIKSVTELDYPKDKLEIQVLDDSNDITSELIAKMVAEYRGNGFDIKHIQREDRIDFKAGALKYGTEICKGELIAIFDADFLPEKEFLIRTVPYFTDKKIGVVQTRWGHLNENYSILTKLQSFALNAHFTVEQTGRNSGNHFINFNGTAGVWRKEAIINSGGWQGDTITEDLDLSYRAQMNDWKFIYLEDVVSPAELPPEMNSMKSQQYRWAKGAAECTRKNLTKVFKAKDILFKTKIHAAFHLLNSFTWVCLICSAILSVPMLFIINEGGPYSKIIALFFVYQISFFTLLIFYFISNYKLSFKKPADILQFILYYPAFLTLSMGISFNNAIGVVKGYMGEKSDFIRTPKFNVVTRKDALSSKSYVKLNLNTVTILEILLSIYFIYGSYVAWTFEMYSAFPFLVMMALGLLLVIIFSIRHKMRAAQ